jgi:hypothetical protein
MQYTGHSFSEMLVRLLPKFLRPRSTRTAPRGLFPAAGEYASECPDPVIRQLYEPIFERIARRFQQVRVFQQGKVHVYLLYILITVVLALAWTSVRSWVVGEP